MSKPRTISRRTFISYCGLGAAGLAVYTTLPAVFTGCSSSTITLEKFTKLSSFATGFAEESLKKELVSQYLLLFEENPIPGASLGDLYTAVGLEGKAAGDINPDDVNLDENLKKLLGTLTSYWYTGKYTVDGKAYLVTYMDSLMYAAIKDVKNIPTTCGGDTGYWSEAPVPGKL